MKKFIKKMIKKTEGFTLVELIVVIAILGILAGVAVPAYSGYLSKANRAADETVLANAETAITSACAMYGYSVDDITVTVTIADSGDKFAIASATTGEGASATANVAAADLTKIQNDCASFLNTTYSSGISIDLDYATTVTYSNGKFAITAPAA